MDLEICGRNAVVCASTAGLGEAVARALAAEGARVVICGRRGDRAKAIAAELPAAIGVQVDLHTPEGPARLVSEASEAFGPVDILVLNGPGPRPGRAQDLGDHDVVAATESLVRPHLRLVSLVLPTMRERGWAGSWPSGRPASSRRSRAWRCRTSAGQPSAGISRHSPPKWPQMESP
jgi:3-oxoacyl-[acyl-carrier protein] reductase